MGWIIDEGPTTLPPPPDVTPLKPTVEITIVPSQTIKIYEVGNTVRLSCYVKSSAPAVIDFQYQ